MGAYNDDVLFCHIPKTAGISCKEYMEANLPGVLWPKPDDEKSIKASKLPIGHIPLRDIPALTGRALSSWERIIAVIRNPYDQQVSQWMFWRDRYARGHDHEHDREAASHPRIHTWLDRSGTPGVDFHIWYAHRYHQKEKWIVQPRGDGKYSFWGGYYRFWLCDENDRIPENLTILRAENLDESFPEALAPWIAGTPPPMPHSNTTPHGRYSEYYGGSNAARIKKSLSIVEEKFAWTFAEGMYPRMDLVEE